MPASDTASASVGSFSHQLPNMIPLLLPHLLAPQACLHCQAETKLERAPCPREFAVSAALHGPVGHLRPEAEIGVGRMIGEIKVKFGLESSSCGHREMAAGWGMGVMFPRARSIAWVISCGGPCSLWGGHCHVPGISIHGAGENRAPCSLQLLSQLGGFLPCSGLWRQITAPSSGVLSAARAAQERHSFQVRKARL